MSQNADAAPYLWFGGSGDRVGPWLVGSVLMRAVRALILTVFSLWIFDQPALAEKRVALVIGNSAYKHVARLQNPANDAAAVVAMLTKAGFDSVETKLDLSVVDMRRALREFGAKTRDVDVAVIYYAGHGIELDGTNYLIPVDAALETDTDVLDETFALDRVLFAVEPARQLRLVILDACRDNPFATRMKRTVGSRTIGRGLARVEPSRLNTMIAFAAKAGSTASDGDGDNSPFAAAVVSHLARPGLDLRKAFGFVRDDVLKATNNAQEPFIYGSLGGNDVALVPAAPAAAPAFDLDVAMQRNYEFALQVGTKPVWDAFVEKYPSGFFTALAKAQRDKLAAEAARVDATNKAKTAHEEQMRLIVEGAQAAEQAKAAEEAAAAERARVAAELAKAAQEARVAEAERTKAAEEAKVTAEAKVAAVALQRAEAQERDEQAYRQARGNLNLLTAYIQNCAICSNKAGALEEINKLNIDAQFFMLKVCNKSPRKASVAVMGRTVLENNDWHVQGWWSIPPRQCNNIRRYVKGVIYLFAQEDGNPKFAWKGNASKLCVASPGPFDRVNRDGYVCQAAEKAVQFSSFSVSDLTFTWDLNP